MALIQVDDLTAGSSSLAGNGIFDVMMKAMTAHIQDQQDNNRITGEDYANIYSSTLQATLAQAIQFLLQKQQADKQAELLEAQTELVNQQTANAVKENDLIQEQIDKLVAETNLVIAETLNVPKQGELIDQQVLLTTEQTSKATSEVNLLDQKLVTEVAQSSDTPTVGGILGAQKDLYNAQKDGFTRNAEQKAAQILSNAFSVIYSTDPDAISPSNAGVGELDIQRAISKLLTGVGA